MDTKLIIIIVLFVTLLLMFINEYTVFNKEPFVNGCSCKNKPMIGTPPSINELVPFVTGQSMVISNLKPSIQPQKSQKPLANVPVKTSQQIPDVSATSKATIPTQQNEKKTDLKESGIIKFIFYHMNGCGHCSDFMKIPKANGKTKFESLVAAFTNDPIVKIVDFQYGRDNEANKFTAFPTIYIVSDKGSQEYNGSQEVEELIKAINRHK